jgi:branched-chain amino acid transport system ATP-binding protein
MHVPPWLAEGDSIDKAVEVFPLLGKRLSQIAGTMSGGQQQQLALARAYVTEPSVVLLDEVSMGLAPQVIDQIFESFTQLISRGVSLLLVEQYVHRALALADRAYLLSLGRVVYSGPASELDEDAVERGYFG